ncbi:MAG TPA: serine/threonine-protein kinase [Kofleriaceae bacterium]|nr:serine/threonine-protein kinase [Kofleriaceae bacterium]
MRFAVRGDLGAGGMGVVVEAYDQVLGRDVAIKILRRDPLADPLVGERFLREARAAAQLRHDSIVQVYDIDAVHGFIVMELVRGEALSARLAREGCLDAAEVQRIARALLGALGAAHDAGIVHRDVKPANVLLGDGGEVKLADFGVAYFADSELTRPGACIGTPMYMAPEQLRAKEIDARADVYAAGATLFEAATGQQLNAQEVPFDVAGAVAAASGDRVLATAIGRAVCEQPRDRFADGRAFAAALDASSTAASARVPRRRAGFALAGIVAATAGAGAVYRWHANTGAPPADTTAAGPPAASPPATSTRTIAMLPFVDRTHDPQLDFASAGLPNLLGIELHAVPGVKVIGYYQLVSNVRDPDGPLEGWIAAAKQLGADVVVRGELTGAADHVQVAIHVATIAGASVEELTSEGRVSDVPERVRGAARPIARAVVGREAETPASAHVSFQADRELQLGIADLERENLQGATEHLRAAVHEAPELALPHYYLALDLYWNSPPAAPALAEIDRALALGLDDARGSMLRALRALVVQDYNGGLAQLRPLAEKYPTDRDILYVLFEGLFHSGHPAEAMSVYRRIIAIAPRFRLALAHPFTFYTARADDAGMAWTLSLSNPAVPEQRAWEARVAIAHREYASTIERLSRMLDDPGPWVYELKLALADAYALTFQLDLAVQIERGLSEQTPPSVGAELAGFAMARGDTADRDHWLDVTVHAAEMMPEGPPRNINLQFAVVSAVLGAPRARLDDLARELDETIVPDYGTGLNLNLGQTMLAEARGDLERVRTFVDSPFPEVAEAAKAAVARARGDRTAAAAAMRRSIDATGDGRFLIVQWARLADDLRALGDHAGVIAACDEVIRPRIFMGSWGAAVGPCLAWTAAAQDALGQRDAARATWQRLASLRPDPVDELGRQARDALAKSAARRIR